LLLASLPCPQFPITAIREIKILKAVRHPNIVHLRDVVSSHVPGREGDVFMVFEFCDHDLTGLLESKVPLSDALCKYYLKSILEGLYHLHSRGILHRDIKGANILISNNGDVRIADMGLARNMSKGGYTNRVVTLWYRAPELLWGSSDYDAKIDMCTSLSLPWHCYAACSKGARVGEGGGSSSAHALRFYHRLVRACVRSSPSPPPLSAHRERGLSFR